MGQHNLPIEQRIERHIVSKNGCWITDLHCHKRGYPLINIDGKMKNVPRVIYEIYYGEITENYLVCHKCSNVACVNPKHLFLGTHQDCISHRMLRGCIAKPKSRTSLNEKSVLEIKYLLAESTLTQQQIADKFNVKVDVISHIKTGKTWTHVIYSSAD